MLGYYEHIYYPQGGNTEWAKINYKNGPYSTQGCGPAALAMVVGSYLRNHNITPDVVGNWIIKHKEVFSLQEMIDYPKAWGLHSREGNTSAAITALMKGYMVLTHIKLSWRNVHHFLVLSSYIKYSEKELTSAASGLTGHTDFVEVYDPSRYGIWYCKYNTKELNKCFDHFWIVTE
jgi:hypothetical protein